MKRGLFEITWINFGASDANQRIQIIINGKVVKEESLSPYVGTYQFEADGGQLVRVIVAEPTDSISYAFTTPQLTPQGLALGSRQLFAPSDTKKMKFIGWSLKKLLDKEEEPVYTGKQTDVRIGLHTVNLPK